MNKSKPSDDIRARSGQVERVVRPPIPLGTITAWGRIEAVGVTGGERYYWMSDGRTAAMIPAFMVETSGGGSYD